MNANDRRIFIKHYITNDRIKSPQVRVIDAEGKQVGVIDTSQAKQMAKEQGLDLLLISPDTKPPVCKLVDIGEYKYKQSKKDKLARKGSKAQVIKELKLSPKISDHDYHTRLNQGRKFLGKSYTVKLSVFFKGRENARQDLGKIVLERYLEDIADVGVGVGDISSGHRSLYIMIAPANKPKTKQGVQNGEKES